jgi:hypothetical protein
VCFYFPVLTVCVFRFVFARVHAMP